MLLHELKEMWPGIVSQGVHCCGEIINADTPALLHSLYTQFVSQPPKPGVGRRISKRKSSFEAGKSDVNAYIAAYNALANYAAHALCYRHSQGDQTPGLAGIVEEVMKRCEADLAKVPEGAIPWAATSDSLADILRTAAERDPAFRELLNQQALASEPPAVVDPVVPEAMVARLG